MSCGLAVLFFVQRSFLFPIPTTTRTAPQAAGFPEAEEHVLTTADGEKVIVWHVPAKPAIPLSLLPRQRRFSRRLLRPLSRPDRRRAGVVALAYRGYADRAAPSEHGLLRDAAAAYAFTTARYSPDSIVVWGFSLGTGVAVALAAEHPVGRLILEAPYTSIVDVAASAFPILPVRLADEGPVPLRPTDRAGQGPIAGHAWRNDPTIPIVFGERLFALARDRSNSSGFPDGGHNDLDYFGAIQRGAAIHRRMRKAEACYCWP